MGVQSDAPTCAHVNSSLVAQQIQLRTHAETGRAIARASGPSRDNQAGQAPLLHAPSSRAHHRRQDRESRAAGRLSDAPCTLPSAPDVFGRSCDKLCYGHVSGERCICAPNHFGYDCSLCAEADAARSLSQRVAAGEPAVLGSLPALAASAGAQRTSHGAQSGAGAGTLAGLSIPRGALAETVVVRLDVFPVEPLVGPEQAHLTPRAEIVQLRPHGLTFAEPITLHITTPAPQNLNDDELVVMYHDDDAQQWRAANGSAWSTRDGALLITAHTSHFSQWSVFSTPAPPSSTAPSLPAPPTPADAAHSPTLADAKGMDDSAGSAGDEAVGIVIVIGLCSGWGGVALCGFIAFVVRRRRAALWKQALRIELERKHLEDKMEQLRAQEEDEAEKAAAAEQAEQAHLASSRVTCRDPRASQESKLVASTTVVAANYVFSGSNVDTGAQEEEAETEGKALPWVLPHDVARDAAFHDEVEAESGEAAEHQQELRDGAPAPAPDGADGAHRLESSPFNLMPMLPAARPGTLVFAIEQRRTRCREGDAPNLHENRTSHTVHLGENAADTEPQEPVADKLRGLIRLSIIEGMSEEAGEHQVWLPETGTHHLPSALARRASGLALMPRESPRAAALHLSVSQDE